MQCGGKFKNRCMHHYVFTMVKNLHVIIPQPDQRSGPDAESSQHLAPAGLAVARLADRQGDEVVD